MEGSDVVKWCSLFNSEAVATCLPSSLCADRHAHKVYKVLFSYACPAVQNM